MKTAGIVAIKEHPALDRCFRHIVSFCDYMIVRIDRDSKYRTNKEELTSIFGDKKYVFISPETKWNQWIWREELLTALHRSNLNPDIVIALDQDEAFDVGAMEEIIKFNKSDKAAMMFTYKSPMPTCDGRVAANGMAYPSSPHMKVYKYTPSLSYVPYTGYAQVHPYSWNSKVMWRAKTQIKHYSFWTKELEESKMKWIKATYGSDKL